MKLTLKILAIVYLVLSILMLSAAYAIIRVIIIRQFSGESMLMTVLLLPAIGIPAIGILCSMRYLKRKDEESALNISVLTGIAAWILTGALIRKESMNPPDLLEFASMLFCIFVGVYTHKLFSKYVKQTFGKENGA